MKMISVKKIIPVGVSLLPFLVFAQDIETDVVDKLKGILDLIIPLLMVVAFAVFLWGVIKFITAGGDEEKRKSAKYLIIYGLIGLFVMVAVWGITNLVAETFSIDTGGTIPAPSFEAD